MVKFGSKKGPMLEAEDEVTESRIYVCQVSSCHMEIDGLPCYYF